MYGSLNTRAVIELFAYCTAGGYDSEQYWPL